MRMFKKSFTLLGRSSFLSSIDFLIVFSKFEDSDILLLDEYLSQIQYMCLCNNTFQYLRSQ